VYPSTASLQSGVPGQIPISVDSRLRELLTTIWRGTVTVKSDLARENADIVAMAASMALITTRVGPNVYAAAWQVTGKGLRYINETEED
jgi:hypothetical protein